MTASAATLCVNSKEAPKLLLRHDGLGSVSLGIEGDLTRLLRAIGNDQVTLGLFAQLAALGSPGKLADADASNFVLGFIDSMAPKDAAETLLVAQMAAVHQASMLMAKRLNSAENLVQQDSAGRALTKLVRTYAGQLESLKRYRSEVQQSVRVEHVTVADGGQAIVGNVMARGRM